MSAAFRLAPHLSRAGVEVVEVWIDGALVATIYPHDEDGIRIWSRHIESVDALVEPGGEECTAVKVEFKQRGT